MAEMDHDARMNGYGKDRSALRYSTTAGSVAISAYGMTEAHPHISSPRGPFFRFPAAMGKSGARPRDC